MPLGLIGGWRWYPHDATRPFRSAEAAALQRDVQAVERLGALHLRSKWLHGLTPPPRLLSRPALDFLRLLEFGGGWSSLQNASSDVSNIGVGAPWSLLALLVKIEEPGRLQDPSAIIMRITPILPPGSIAFFTWLRSLTSKPGAHVG